MMTYELEVSIPYWGPDFRLSRYSSKRVFEAKNDREAKKKVPKLVPKISLTRDSEGQNKKQKIHSRAVRLIKVVEVYE